MDCFNNFSKWPKSESHIFSDIWQEVKESLKSDRWYKFTKVCENGCHMFDVTFLLKHTTRFIVERYLKVHFGANKRSLNYFFCYHRVHESG